MLRRLKLATCLWVSIAANLISASPVQAGSLDKAQAAYQSGQYEDAVNQYLQVIEASESKSSPSPSASVYHNLGLAFDRQKELGQAVASYLRATQLQPRQGDFQYNLRFLLGQTQDKLDNNFHRPMETSFLLDQWTTERELFYLSISVFLIAAAVYSYAFLRTRYRTAATSVGSIFFLLSLYSAASLFYKSQFVPDQGAVIAPKLEAYSGPTQSVVIFELHAGAPFQILETSNDWVKIELSDQKRGWVRSEGIASFGNEHNILPAKASSKS
ncbi:MAG: SH3 domain-containing protein [Oligoflexus sp.]|nr:SH3 domain-containing protein [Oligoflexus sp.]